MPIVANLTPHETGLKDWTEADFIRALREGKRKDGTRDLRSTCRGKPTARWATTELKAIYAYLRTVPPKPKGNR